MGRFIAEDPLGFAAGDANFYAYVSGSPISCVDPPGLQAHGIWINPSDSSYAPGLSIPRVPGRYPILAHATEEGLYNENGKRMTVDQVVDRIFSDSEYVPGMPVDFYACNLANGDYIQRVADKPFAPVTAAPGFQAVFPDFNNGYGRGSLIAPCRVRSRPYPWPEPLPFLPAPAIEFRPRFGEIGYAP